jgi:hypothetical protein
VAPESTNLSQVLRHCSCQDRAAHAWSKLDGVEGAARLIGVPTSPAPCAGERLLARPTADLKALTQCGVMTEGQDFLTRALRALTERLPPVIPSVSQAVRVDCSRQPV